MKDILNIALKQHFLSQSWLLTSDHMNFPFQVSHAPTRKATQAVMHLVYHENNNEIETIKHKKSEVKIMHIKDSKSLPAVGKLLMSSPQLDQLLYSTLPRI